MGGDAAGRLGKSALSFRSLRKVLQLKKTMTQKTSRKRAKARGGIGGRGLSTHQLRQKGEKIHLLGGPAGKPGGYMVGRATRRFHIRRREIPESRSGGAGKGSRGQLPQQVRKELERDWRGEWWEGEKSKKAR